MFEMCPSKSVVVGIDGSQAAVRAARWAVDEVASTETPLRLLYSRELGLGADRSACHGLLAAAEDAVYDAYAAVEATGKSVKVEIDILEGRARRQNRGAPGNLASRTRRLTLLNRKPIISNCWRVHRHPRQENGSLDPTGHPACVSRDHGRRPPRARPPPRRSTTPQVPRSMHPYLRVLPGRLID